MPTRRSRRSPGPEVAGGGERWTAAKACGVEFRTHRHRTAPQRRPHARPFELMLGVRGQRSPIRAPTARPAFSTTARRRRVASSAPEAIVYAAQAPAGDRQPSACSRRTSWPRRQSLPADRSRISGRPRAPGSTQSRRARPGRRQFDELPGTIGRGRRHRPSTPASIRCIAALAVRLQIASKAKSGRSPSAPAAADADPDHLARAVGRQVPPRPATSEREPRCRWPATLTGVRPREMRESTPRNFSRDPDAPSGDAGRLAADAELHLRASGARRRSATGACPALASRATGQTVHWSRPASPRAAPWAVRRWRRRASGHGAASTCDLVGQLTPEPTSYLMPLIASHRRVMKAACGRDRAQQPSSAETGFHLLQDKRPSADGSPRPCCTLATGPLSAPTAGRSPHHVGEFAELHETRVPGAPERISCARPAGRDGR